MKLIQAKPATVATLKDTKAEPLIERPRAAYAISVNQGLHTLHTSLFPAEICKMQPIAFHGCTQDNANYLDSGGYGFTGNFMLLNPKVQGMPWRMQDFLSTIFNHRRYRSLNDCIGFAIKHTLDVLPDNGYRKINDPGKLPLLLAAGGPQVNFSRSSFLECVDAAVKRKDLFSLITVTKEEIEGITSNANEKTRTSFISRKISIALQVHHDLYGLLAQKIVDVIEAVAQGRLTLPE